MLIMQILWRGWMIGLWWKFTWGENSGRLWPEMAERAQIVLAQREFHRYLSEQFFPKPSAVNTV